MKRRDFVKTGVAVGAVLGVAQEAKGASPSTTSGGFRLVGQSVTTEPAEFAVDGFVVECPYPVGSKAWVSIADRDDRGLTVVGHKSVTGSYRRMVFPRFQKKNMGRDLDVADLQERAHAVYLAVKEHGFDNARGPDHKWKVVHVEFRCPDGVEHIMCGMPVEWDSKLALGVMVKGQIS